MRAQHTKVRLTGSGGQCLPVDSLCHSISALVFCRGWTCREVLPKACCIGAHFLHRIFGVSAVSMLRSWRVWFQWNFFMVHLHLSSRFFCFLVTPVLHCLVRNSSVTRWSWEALLGWSILCLEPQAWSWDFDPMAAMFFRECSFSGGKVDNAKPLRKWDCWMSSS